MRTLTPQDEFRLLMHLDSGAGILEEEKNPIMPHIVTPQSWKATRNVLAAVLMMDAGLRVGEVVGLIWTDVYFNERPVSTLTVRAAIAKGRKERHIPVTQRLHAALNRFNSDLLLVQDFPAYRKLISDRPQGHAITTRTLERIITAAGIAALGRPVNPHMLRHTYATKLLRVTDIRTVQELLGHKNLSSTQIYTHVNDEDKRNAVANMETKFSTANGGISSPDLPGQVYKQRGTI